MAVYRRSTRARFTLLLLVLTAVTILTLDQRGNGSRMVDSLRAAAQDAMAPVQSATDRVLSPVGGVVAGAFNYRDLEEENARLRAELDAARGDRLRAAEVERELQAVLDQQRLEFVGDIPRVAARVVSTSPSAFELSVVIDRGRSAGVDTGMPVVTGAGLVGRVVSVSGKRATVRLLTDPRFDVGVRLSTSGDVGVASGEGRNRPLRVALVDPSTQAEKGEVAVTSGLQQSRYPAGIPVGRVRASELRSGRLERDVTLDPVVNFGRLTFVTVLQWNPA